MYQRSSFQHSYQAFGILCFRYSNRCVIFHLILVLICISRMASDVEHIFIYLSFILFNKMSFLIFSTYTGFLLLTFLSDMWFANILSQCIICLFIFLTGPYIEQTFLQWWCPVYLFSSMNHASVSCLINVHQVLGRKDFLHFLLKLYCSIQWYILS